MDNDEKYMNQNIPQRLVFFCLIFSNIKMLIFGVSFISYVLQLSRRNDVEHYTDFTPPCHENNIKKENSWKVMFSSLREGVGSLSFKGIKGNQIFKEWPTKARAFWVNRGITILKILKDS